MIMRDECPQIKEATREQLEEIAFAAAIYLYSGMTVGKRFRLRNGLTAVGLDSTSCRPLFDEEHGE
jgi:hypothetical protein